MSVPERPPTVPVVDDLPKTSRLPRCRAQSARIPGARRARRSAVRLLAVAAEQPEYQQVLLDLLMPAWTAIRSRAMREDPATAYLPVIMITASGDQEKIHAIEAGADDFVEETVCARRTSRSGHVADPNRALHDTMERQSAELADWNSGTGDRVAAQLAELQRAGRLGGSCPRNWPTLSSVPATVVPGEPSPRDRRDVVRSPALHTVRRIGGTRRGDGRARRIPRSPSATWCSGFEGTLERFTGDGLMVFFKRPAALAWTPLSRAIRMAVAMRSRVHDLAAGWSSPGVTISASVPASRRAMPLSAGSGSRAGTLRGRRKRDERRRPAVCPGSGRSDPRNPAGTGRGR